MYFHDLLLSLKKKFRHGCVELLCSFALGVFLRDSEAKLGSPLQMNALVAVLLSATPPLLPASAWDTVGEGHGTL